jgi:FKBP-type peptidyl-prolyl cis-trans isomerase
MLMRRTVAALFTPLIAVTALTACGSSAPASTANNSVTASAGFGTAPTVKIPAAKAGDNLYYKTETTGTGQALGKSGAFLGNYVLYVWSGTKHSLVESTYTATPQVLSTQLLPGLKTALVGQKMGSRVLAVLPPKYGFGTSGNANVGVTGTDTLVFVVDLIKTYAATASASGTSVSNGGDGLPTVAATPGTAPTITIPPTSPPSSLVVKTLIKGSGPPVTKDQEVVTQYVGVNWRTKTVFDSSWSRGAAFGFQIGAQPAQAIPGFDTGLMGVTVGSRVMLVIPPKDGYGSSGNSSAGINGTDTLVYVVDILDAVGANSH